MPTLVDLILYLSRPVQNNFAFLLQMPRDYHTHDTGGIEQLSAVQGLSGIMF